MSDPIELQTKVAGIILRVAPLRNSDNLVFSLISETETLAIKVSTPVRISCGPPRDIVMVESFIFVVADGQNERLKDWLKQPRALQQEASA